MGADQRKNKLKVDAIVMMFVQYNAYVNMIM
jgi:hypothetical protein